MLATDARGKFAVGQASDMSRFGPKSHLHSVVNDWSKHYIRSIQSIMDGTWKSRDYWGGMKDGVIVQEGTPAEIYGKPSHAFVADFIGKTNFLKGRITASALDADGLITVETEIGELKTRITDAFSAADKVTVVVRPESIGLGADRVDGANMVEGTVDSLSFLGNLVDCVVPVGGRSLQVQLVPPTTVQAGDRVKLNLPPDQCVAMPD